MHVPSQSQGYLTRIMQPPQPAAGHSLANAPVAPIFPQGNAVVHSPAHAPAPAHLQAVSSGAALPGTAPAAAAAAGEVAPCTAAGQLLTPTAGSNQLSLPLERTSPLAATALPSASTAQSPRAGNLHFAHSPAALRPFSQAPAATGHPPYAAAAATAASMDLPAQSPIQQQAAPALVPGDTLGQLAHALVAGAPDLAQVYRQLPAIGPMPAAVAACAGPVGQLTGVLCDEQPNCAAIQQVNAAVVIMRGSHRGRG